MAKLKDYIESRIMETSTTFLTSELGKGSQNSSLLFLSRISSSDTRATRARFKVEHWSNQRSRAVHWLPGHSTNNQSKHFSLARDRLSQCFHGYFPGNSQNFFGIFR